MISHCLKKGTQPCRVADDGSPSTTFSLGSPVGSPVKTLPVWASQALSRPLWHSTLLTKPLACWRISPANYLSSPCFGNGCNKTWKHAALALWLVRGRRAEFELFGQCFHLLAGNMFFAAASWKARSRSTSAVWKLSTKNAPSTRAARSSSWWCCFKMGPQNSCLGQMEQWHWHASTIHKPFYEDMDHKMY